MPRKINIELDRKTTFLVSEILYLEDLIDGETIYSVVPDEDKRTEFEKLDDKKKIKKQNELIVDLAKQLIQKSDVGEVEIVNLWPSGVRIIGSDQPRTYGINVVYRRRESYHMAYFGVVGGGDEISIKGEVDRPLPKELLGSLEKKKN